MTSSTRAIRFSYGVYLSIRTKAYRKSWKMSLYIHSTVIRVIIRGSYLKYQVFPDGEGPHK